MTALCSPPASATSRTVWWQVLRSLPGETWREVRAHPWALLGTLVLGLAAASVLIPVEQSWQAAHAVAQPGTVLHILAEYASWWGKLENGVGLILLGWLAVDLSGRRACGQRTVITVLWAQLVAGVLVNLAKVGFGRPRPRYEAPDGFFGPSLDYAFQSFPSGHTTAAFALAATLGTFFPRGLPLFLLYAGLVGWSRVALYVHHPSDVVMGAALGCACGVLCARAGRRASAQLAATLPARPS
ncbi:MAG: phosphatase PAP2 family protein [Opitutales bacterium]